MSNQLPTGLFINSLYLVNQNQQDPFSSTVKLTTDEGGGASFVNASNNKPILSVDSTQGVQLNSNTPLQSKKVIINAENDKFDAVITYDKFAYNIPESKSNQVYVHEVFASNAVNNPSIVSDGNSNIYMSFLDNQNLSIIKMNSNYDVDWVIPNIVSSNVLVKDEISSCIAADGSIVQCFQVFYEGPDNGSNALVINGLGSSNICNLTYSNTEYLQHYFTFLVKFDTYGDLKWISQLANDALKPLNLCCTSNGNIHLAAVNHFTDVDIHDASLNHHMMPTIGDWNSLGIYQFSSNGDFLKRVHMYHGIADNSDESFTLDNRCLTTYKEDGLIFTKTMLIKPYLDVPLFTYSNYQMWFFNSSNQAIDFNTSPYDWSLSSNIVAALSNPSVDNPVIRTIIAKYTNDLDLEWVSHVDSEFLNKGYLEYYKQDQKSDVIINSNGDVSIMIQSKNQIDAYGSDYIKTSITSSDENVNVILRFSSNGEYLSNNITFTPVKNMNLQQTSVIVSQSTNDHYLLRYDAAERKNELVVLNSNGDLTRSLVKISKPGNKLGLFSKSEDSISLLINSSEIVDLESTYFDVTQIGSGVSVIDFPSVIIDTILADTSFTFDTNKVFIKEAQITNSLTFPVNKSIAIKNDGMYFNNTKSNSPATESNVLQIITNSNLYENINAPHISFNKDGDYFASLDNASTYSILGETIVSSQLYYPISLVKCNRNNTVIWKIEDVLKIDFNFSDEYQPTITYATKDGGVIKGVFIWAQRQNMPFTFIIKDVVRENKYRFVDRDISEFGNVPSYFLPSILSVLLVIKYNADGSLEYAYTLDSDMLEFRGITEDSNGNVYLSIVNQYYPVRVFDAQSNSYIRSNAGMYWNFGLYKFTKQGWFDKRVQFYDYRSDYLEYANLRQRNCVYASPRGNVYLHTSYLIYMRSYYDDREQYLYIFNDGNQGDWFFDTTNYEDFLSNINSNYVKRISTLYSQLPYSNYGEMYRFFTIKYSETLELEWVIYLDCVEGYNEPTNYDIYEHPHGAKTIEVKEHTDGSVSVFIVTCYRNMYFYDSNETKIQISLPDPTDINTKPQNLVIRLSKEGKYIWHEFYDDALLYINQSLHNFVIDQDDNMYLGTYTQNEIKFMQISQNGDIINNYLTTSLMNPGEYFYDWPYIEDFGYNNIGFALDLDGEYPAIVCAPNTDNAITIGEINYERGLVLFRPSKSEKSDFQLSISDNNNTLMITPTSISIQGSNSLSLPKHCITARNIAMNAVGSSAIIEKSVKNKNLSDNSVSTSNIINNSVTWEKLNEQSVSSSKFVTENITMESQHLLIAGSYMYSGTAVNLYTISSGPFIIENNFLKYTGSKKMLIVVKANLLFTERGDDNQIEWYVSLQGQPRDIVTGKQSTLPFTISPNELIQIHQYTYFPYTFVWYGYSSTATNFTIDIIETAFPYQILDTALLKDKTGSSNIVLSESPTFTGVITASNINLSGTMTASDLVNPFNINMLTPNVNLSGLMTASNINLSSSMNASNINLHDSMSASNINLSGTISAQCTVQKNIYIIDGKWEYKCWTGQPQLPGNTPTDTYNAVKNAALNITPNITGFGSTVGVVGSGDNFLTRWFGYFTPTVSGNYTFSMSADDAAMAWIGASAALPEISNTVNNYQLSAVWNGAFGPYTYTVYVKAFEQIPILIYFSDYSFGEYLGFSVTAPGQSSTSDFSKFIINANISPSNITIPGLASFSNITACNIDINDNSLSASKLIDLSITTAKYALSSVNSNAILDSNIIASKLAAGAVTYGVIADGAVGSNAIVDSNIIASKLAAGAVTYGVIADGAVGSNAIVDSNIIASKLAAGAVTYGVIASGAVGSNAIVDSNIIASKLAAGAVTYGVIADGAVGSNAILDGAVTSSKLAPGLSFSLTNGSVGSNELANSNVIVGKLGAGAVTYGIIADGAVGSNAILNANIIASKMAINSIGSNSIIDSNITLGKIESTALSYLRTSNFEWINVTSNMQVASSVLLGDKEIKLVGSSARYSLVNSNNVLTILDTSTSAILGVAGTQLMTFSNNKVGVAKSNPDYAFHVVGEIYATGDVTAFSDARAKSNLQKIDDPLEKISKLSGYTYDMMYSGANASLTKVSPRSTGIIAQDLEQILPEAVHIDSQGFLSVAYGNMAGLFVECIKELSEKNKQLEERIKVFEDRMMSM